MSNVKLPPVKGAAKKDYVELPDDSIVADASMATKKMNETADPLPKDAKKPAP